MLRQGCLLLLALATGATCAAGEVSAAGPEDASHACATIVGSSERLACYDKAFPPVDGAVTAQSETEKRQKAAGEFGLNRQQLLSRDPERREYTPDQIEAKVVKVVENASGQRVLTLDNGQSWLLTEVTSRGRLSDGDTVSIRSAALGSFLLFTSTRVPLRARRLR